MKGSVVDDTRITQYGGFKGPKSDVADLTKEDTGRLVKVLNGEAARRRHARILSQRNPTFDAPGGGHDKEDLSKKNPCGEGPRVEVKTIDTRFRSQAFFETREDFDEWVLTVAEPIQKRRIDAAVRAAIEALKV